MASRNQGAGKESQRTSSRFNTGWFKAGFFANVAAVAPVWQYEEVGIVSWSVSTEWCAYLVFPLVCPLLARIRTVPAAVVCAIGAAAIELGIELTVLMLQGRINLFALRAYGTDAALPNRKHAYPLDRLLFRRFAGCGSSFSAVVWRGSMKCGRRRSLDRLALCSTS
ncbi:hypothetical protein [Bradyrhizobium sp. USDA 4473]